MIPPIIGFNYFLTTAAPVTPSPPRNPLRSEDISRQGPDEPQHSRRYHTSGRHGRSMTAPARHTSDTAPRSCTDRSCSLSAKFAAKENSSPPLPRKPVVPRENGIVTYAITHRRSNVPRRLTPDVTRIPHQNDRRNCNSAGPYQHTPQPDHRKKAKDYEQYYSLFSPHARFNGATSPKFTFCPAVGPSRPHSASPTTCAPGRP